MGFQGYPLPPPFWKLVFLEAVNNSRGIHQEIVKPPSIDLSPPYITEELECIEGQIKEHPEDFMVDEVSLCEPVGVGSHLYVKITKVNQTTRDGQLQVSELFNLRPENIATTLLREFMKNDQGG